MSRYICVSCQASAEVPTDAASVPCPSCAGDMLPTQLVVEPWLVTLRRWSIRAACIYGVVTLVALLGFLLVVRWMWHQFESVVRAFPQP
jgi:hypothetical protein